MRVCTHRNHVSLKIPHQRTSHKALWFFADETNNRAFVAQALTSQTYHQIVLQDHVMSRR